MHIHSAAPAPNQPFIPWRHALTLILAPMALFSSKAHAEEARGWEATVGAGAIYMPDYEGSNDMEVLPFPFISVTYNDLFYIQGPELGLNLLRLHPTDDLSIKAGPLARYRRDRSEKRNRALKGLGKVDMAIEVGGAARVDYRNWHLGLSLAKDVAGGHEGLVGRGEIGADFTLSDRLTASASAYTTWVDRDYMQTYFGVTSIQAARSGLPTFKADGGIKDAGATVGLSYQLSDHWLIAGTGGYARLLNDAKNNPLVRQRGSADQWQAGLFVAYRF